MIFFTDRDLGKKFPELLRRAGIEIIRHDDVFSQDTSDEEWLQNVGKEGWIALTHDKNIRYKPNEQAAVMEASVGLIVLVGTQTPEDRAASFLASLNVIARFVKITPRPFIAKLYRSPRPGKPGRMKLWVAGGEGKNA